MSVDDARTRSLLQAVLRDPGDVVSRCRREGSSVAEALRARAALARLLRSGPDGRWQQFGVRLTGPAETADFFGSQLVDLARDWAARNPSRRLVFLRKGPGVLIRTADARSAAEGPEVGAELQEALGPRLLVRPYGHYDPEVALFGGRRGSDLAHVFHGADSLAVLAFHRLALAGKAPLMAPEYSLLLLMTTFAGLTADPGEHWDVWTRFAATGRLSTRLETLPEDGGTARAHAWVAARFADPGSLAASPALVGLLDPVLEAVQQIGRDLPHALPTLAAPLRSLLPFWAVHHWNRMGFDWDTQRLLTGVVVAGGQPW